LEDNAFMPAPLTLRQSHERSALWETAATEALEALRELGLWDGAAPNVRVARRQKGFAGWAASRWARSAGAQIARAMSPAARQCPDRALAAYGHAVSAMALCGPERALVVPQSWVDGSPKLPGWTRSENDFRVAICAHELAHLALDREGDPSNATAQALALVGPAEGGANVPKALWPKHPDEELAGLQRQWRAMFVEGFADCVACLACERTGLGSASDFAAAFWQARDMDERGDSADQQGRPSVSHDTRHALDQLRSLLARPQARSLGARELCVTASRDGLARAIEEEARERPFGLRRLLAGEQGALPNASQNRRSAP
jgi:hypothetical protein